MLKKISLRRLSFVLLLGLAGCLFGNHNARAEMTINEFQQLLNDGGPQAEVAKSFMAGLGDGISWTNEELLVSGREPLYCPPEKLAITTDQTISILNNYVTNNASLVKSLPPDQRVIGMLLVFALRDTFPCK